VGNRSVHPAQDVPAVLPRNNVSTFFQYTPKERGAASIALPSSTIPLAAESSPPSDSDNLTGQLTELLVGRFPLGQENLFSQDNIADILASGIVQFPEPAFFTEEDVVADPSDTELARIAYIESLDRVLMEHFEEFLTENTATALEALFERNDPRILEGIAAAIPGYLDELLAIEVPSQWTAVHVQILNIWRMKLSLYEAILSYSDDPLKAQLALQHIGEVIEQDVQLQKLIRDYYDQHSAS